MYWKATVAFYFQNVTSFASCRKFLFQRCLSKQGNYSLHQLYPSSFSLCYLDITILKSDLTFPLHFEGDLSVLQNPLGGRRLMHCVHCRQFGGTGFVAIETTCSLSLVQSSVQTRGWSTVSTWLLVCCNWQICSSGNQTVCILVLL